MDQILQQIAQTGSVTSPLVFEPPTTEAEVSALENMLGYTLPADFKQVLLNVSSHCDFKWRLEESIELPSALKGIFCGELYWNTRQLITFNEDKDNWIQEVFPNPEDDYDKVWHDKLVFQEISNGDYLGIDLTPDQYGKIIYLSHDDGDGHGYVMAHSFSELLTNWIPLGCVGAEDWQWLPYCESKETGIDPLGPNAALWKKLMKLD